MGIKYGRIMLVLFALVAVTFQCFGTERVFILKDQEQIVQYRIRQFVNKSVKSEVKNEVTQVTTYNKENFPGVFPADSIKMRRGNILSVYDQSKELKGRLVYNPRSDRLELYDGNPGDRTSLTGKLLENPNLDESFRVRSHMYFKDWASPSRYESLVHKFENLTGSTYKDIFVLDGKIFAISGDHIYQLSDKKGKSLKNGPKTALVLAESELTSAAISPWGEVFIADSVKNELQRVSLKEGVLVAGDPLSNSSLSAPRGMDFTASGELFVANGKPGSTTVSRFKFKLGGWKNWNPVAKKGLDVGGSGAIDVALARPVGQVISEKTHPIKEISKEEAGGHYGISQTMFIGPDINSEATIIALVQYAPGGNTPVHYHPNMEQIEIVISGKALWEIGEFEQEVGPGDVIFCPRFVKHGYKVLGDQPFKFLQLEWRNIED